MNRLHPMPSVLFSATLLLLAVGPGLTKAAPTPGREAPYRVIERWSIPNGGYGRVIVVSPTYRNEADMRALGQRLRDETRADRHAVVEVYDDEGAARMRRDAFAERLDRRALAFHDQHKVAHYSKNGNTGHHQFTIQLKGVWGPWIVLDYAKGTEQRHPASRR